MDCLVWQIEEQGPGHGVVVPHYLDGLPGHQICGVGAPGPVVHSTVPPEVKVSSSLVVEVGLCPGIESHKAVEPSLCWSESFLAEAEMPLANRVSFVAETLQLVGQ